MLCHRLGLEIWIIASSLESTHPYLTASTIFAFARLISKREPYRWNIYDKLGNFGVFSLEEVSSKDHYGLPSESQNDIKIWFGAHLTQEWHVSAWGYLERD